VCPGNRLGALVVLGAFVVLGALGTFVVLVVLVVFVDDCEVASWEAVAAVAPPSSHALSTSDPIAKHAIA
jgi:hypothetical protein